MYNTLFPRTNASPYLFFNWPLTYSCLFFFFAERNVIIAISHSDERGNGNGTHTLKKRRKQRQNNTRRLSLCATSIEAVTREDMKRVVGGLVVRRRKSASSARRRAWKKEKPTRVPFDRDRRVLDAIARGRVAGSRTGSRVASLRGVTRDAQATPTRARGGDHPNRALPLGRSRSSRPRTSVCSMAMFM